MEIWLSMDDKKLRLPILPPTIEVSGSNINERININELGNINILGKEDLKEITLETFFPNDDEYYFLEYSGFPKPYECVEIIEKWKATPKPIRLIVTDTNINMEMGIESFTHREQDGTGDVYYTLELSEYKRLKVQTKSKGKYEAPKTKRPAPPPVKAKTYKVKKGDTLWNISKKFTGNAMNYKKIAKENGIKNPNKIYPGQVIKI